MARQPETSPSPRGKRTWPPCSSDTSADSPARSRQRQGSRTVEGHVLPCCFFRLSWRLCAFCCFWSHGLQVFSFTPFCPLASPGFCIGCSHKRARGLSDVFYGLYYKAVPLKQKYVQASVTQTHFFWPSVPYM